MSQIVVIDLETTDKDPEKAHIVEWAVAVKGAPWFGSGGGWEMQSALVRPPVPIPAETSAVHQIIDRDVESAMTLEEQLPTLARILGEPGTIAVAHNADYERAILGRHALPQVPWVCTYKAACRVFPESPGLSNEVLRHWLGLGTGRSHHQAAHSAVHDAMVTGQIFDEIMGRKVSINDLIEWSDQPALLPTCPIGEWRGRKWEEIDDGFLRWIIRKIADRRDVVFCAEVELRRRDEAEKVALPPSDVPF